MFRLILSSLLACPVLATGGAARTDRPGAPLPTGAAARFGTVRLRHGGGVTCVAFAPDGKPLASSSLDRTVRLWDPATGRELRRFEGHKAAVESVAFAPDGKL